MGYIAEEAVGQGCACKGVPVFFSDSHEQHPACRSMFYLEPPKQFYPSEWEEPAMQVMYTGHVLYDPLLLRHTHDLRLFVTLMFV